MGGTGVIDSFLGIFTSYIDSGFGLLGGEVTFLASTLIVIDVTLAALFWAWAPDEDIIARLVKKTIFVGAFAYLISNWNNLAKIIFDSFAGLGLLASGTGFTTADLLRPGRVAQTGLDAGRPLLESISDLMGWIAVFENLVQILCLFFAWALVILAFFILAIQLFVTLIEFKLSTLAGFVLIPFGLCPAATATCRSSARRCRAISAGRCSEPARKANRSRRPPCLSRPPIPKNSAGSPNLKPPGRASCFSRSGRA